MLLTHPALSFQSLFKLVWAVSSFIIFSRMINNFVIVFLIVFQIAYPATVSPANTFSAGSNGSRSLKPRSAPPINQTVRFNTQPSISAMVLDSFTRRKPAGRAVAPRYNSSNLSTFSSSFNIEDKKSYTGSSSPQDSLIKDWLRLNCWCYRAGYFYIDKIPIGQCGKLELSQNWEQGSTSQEDFLGSKILPSPYLKYTSIFKPCPSTF